MDDDARITRPTRVWCLGALLLDGRARESASPKEPGIDRRNTVGYVICGGREEAIARFSARMREENPGYIVESTSCIELGREELERALDPMRCDEPAVRLERPADAEGRVDKFSAGNIDCLRKAKVGEPMWIMIGRDPVYEEAVEAWASAREAAIADGRIPDTPHEREHIETARRYARAGWRNRG